MYSSRDKRAQLATDSVARPSRSTISDPPSTTLEQLASGENISGRVLVGSQFCAQEVVALNAVRREGKDALVCEIDLEQEGLLAGDFNLLISGELGVTSGTTPGLRLMVAPSFSAGLVGTATTLTTPFTQSTT